MKTCMQNKKIWKIDSEGGGRGYMVRIEKETMIRLCLSEIGNCYNDQKVCYEYTGINMYGSNNTMNDSKHLLW